MTTAADWDVARIERLAPDAKALLAARKLLKEKRFSAIETLPDGRGWWAKCRGQTDNYETSTSRPTAGNFTTHCTCPSYKQPCKHAVALLLYLAENPNERPAEETAAAAPRPAGDFEALLGAVFAGPEDSVARLVFADFVEEQGDTDRAVLIRLQVERAGKEGGKKPRRAGAPGLPPAEAAIADRLLEAVPESVRESFRFRNGFLEFVASDEYGNRADLGDSRSWPRAVRDLFADGWVEAVRLAPNQYSGYLPPLTAAAVDICLRVGTVDFGGRTIDGAILARAAADLRPNQPGSRLKRVLVPDGNRQQWEQYLADAADAPLEASAPGERAFIDPPDALFARQLAAGALRGVHTLAVSGGLSAAAATSLADCPDAAGLRTLYLTDMPLSEAHAAAVGASPHLAGVTSLKLYRVGFEPGAAAAWLDSPLAGRAGVLDLEGSAPFGDADLDLMRRRDWPALTSLTVPGEGPTFPAVRALVTSGAAPRLTRLGLGERCGSPLDRLGLLLGLRGRVQHLGAGRAAWELSPPGGGSALRLTFGALPADWPAGAEALDWSGVSAVRADRCEVEPEWFATLAACFPAGLDALSVTWCDLKVPHAKALAKALDALKPASLNLANNVLGAQSIQALVSAPGFAAVRRLDLSTNPLQPSALDALLANPHAAGLEELTLKSVAHDTLPKAARTAFAKKAKGIKLVWG